MMCGDQQPLLIYIIIMSLTLLCQVVTTHRRPNIILFFADDLGYGDLSSYGHPTQEWNALDQMAREGLRFTQWYSAAVICSPSRAALLTGRLPFRTGVIGFPHVFIPSHTVGLPKYEITLAELLRDVSYSTGIVGKWHLGINEFHFDDGRHLPHHHGFDYVGSILPFTLQHYCDTEGVHREVPRTRSCFLYQNDTIIQQPIDLSRLSGRLVQDAKAFIYNNADRPFFLYFPLVQTHTPMFYGHGFRGSSRRGPYGDQVNEMAWSVSEVLDTVRSLQLEKDTLAIFLSDNGPYWPLCNEAGSAGPLKGGKSNFYEGGLRTPAIAWWPGVIEAGKTSGAVVSTTDLYVTLADLANATLPIDRVIDGHNIKHILMDSQSDPKGHDILYFYCDEFLMAVRYKQYKIHFRFFEHIDEILDSSRSSMEELCRNGHSWRKLYMDETCADQQVLEKPRIFNIDNDPEEKYLLSVEDNREVLKEVDKLIKIHQTTIIPSEIEHLLLEENALLKMSPCCNPPYCFCNYSPMNHSITNKVDYL